MTLPGHHLHRWASRVFSPQTMARVIEPMLADLQLEYARAHAAGRRWYARWIRLAGYATCTRVVMVYGSQAAWRVLREPSDDLQAVRRVAVFTTLFAVLVTGFFAGLPFLGLVLADPRDAAVTLSDDPVERIRLLALLLPQALPHSIPVALMLGLSAALGSRRLSRHVMAVVLALALCGSVVSFGAMGWAAPLANQEFRTTLAGSVQPKGSAELTLGEIRSMRSRLSAMLRESPAPQFAHIHLERTDLRYHRRYALPAASLVVVLLLVARARTTNRLRLVSQGAIACAVYFGLLVAGDVATRDGWLNGVVSAWLPNVLFVATAAALSLRRRFVASGV